MSPRLSAAVAPTIRLPTNSRRKAVAATGTRCKRSVTVLGPDGDDARSKSVGPDGSLYRSNAGCHDEHIGFSRGAVRSVHVEADTIAEAWHASLGAFLEEAELYRFDSIRGPCSEALDVVMGVKRPLVGDVSADYPAELIAVVEGYAAGFLGDRAVRGSTVADRLYSWGSQEVDGPGIDQVARVEEALRSSPASRSTILSFWDPAIDPSLENPVSPLIASFRVRDDAIVSTLVARSVDAWLGAFPMMYGFSGLLGRLSENVGVLAGQATFMFLSYHLYDVDLPIVRGMPI